MVFFIVLCIYYKLTKEIFTMSDNKEIESRLVVKATAELQEEIKKELEAEDKSIASLLEDEEEKEKGETSK